MEYKSVYDKENLNLSKCKLYGEKNIISDNYHNLVNWSISLD